MFHNENKKNILNKIIQTAQTNIIIQQTDSSLNNLIMLQRQPK